MNDKNRNLLVRIVTALLLLPVVLFLIWKGGWWCAGLLAFASAASAAEYLHIVWKRLTPFAFVVIAAAAVLPLLPELSPRDCFAWAFFAAGAIFLLSWSYHLLRGPLPEAPTLSAHALTALIYGGLGMMTLSALRLVANRGLGWVIAALVITWGNDTSAYFAGRIFGKHKLYPSVSPNKTWEGFFGGMAGSIVGMIVLKLFFYPWLGWVDCVVVGFLGGLFGPAGDLCESMLKRAYGVKDSGKSIPGHGGMLDRIDALLFNGPMVFAWVYFVRAHLVGG